MSSRAQYLIALVESHPLLVATTSLSLFLCGSVFIGALFLKNSKHSNEARFLPLEDELPVSHERGAN